MKFSIEKSDEAVEGVRKANIINDFEPRKKFYKKDDFLILLLI
jgi:hypothetical protein